MNHKNRSLPANEWVDPWETRGSVGHQPHTPREPEGGAAPDPSVSPFFPFSPGEKIRARNEPGYMSFASPPIFAEAMIRKTAVILPEYILVLRRELMR
ncbi:MAG: hypothetical protein CVV32_05550 [Methanomicrobiales archaeon HGW-Methanomicrobiales-3]|nr:MAG: hypothetical protein CVV32_05550 [Methanomicrobiales archaeon HGW-Methanomicrobiales-3]